MQYEVWGLHPANHIETFESQSEALEEVRGLLEAGWAAGDLSLGRVEDSGGVLVAEGDAPRLVPAALGGRDVGLELHRVINQAA